MMSLQTEDGCFMVRLGNYTMGDMIFSINYRQKENCVTLI